MKTKVVSKKRKPVPRHTGFFIPAGFHFYAGYTEEGVRRIAQGFVFRIINMHLPKDELQKKMDESHHIFDPCTKNLASDIKKSVLDNKEVENLLYNLKIRKAENKKLGFQ